MQASQEDDSAPAQQAAAAVEARLQGLRSQQAAIVDASQVRE